MKFRSKWHSKRISTIYEAQLQLGRMRERERERSRTKGLCFTALINRASTRAIERNADTRSTMRLTRATYMYTPFCMASTSSRTRDYVLYVYT